MSSLALTSMASSLAPTARPKDPLAKLLPGPLTTLSRLRAERRDRAVRRGVRSRRRRRRTRWTSALTMKAEGGQTVFQTREERDSSELAGSSGGYGFIGAHPAARHSHPGLYVLRVEAQSRIGDRPTVARETVVNVVATPAHRTASPSTSRAPRTRCAGTCRTRAPLRHPRTCGGTRARRRHLPHPRHLAAPVQMTTINSDMMSGIDRAAADRGAHRRRMARRCGSGTRRAGRRRRSISPRTWSSPCFSAAGRRAAIRSQITGVAQRGRRARRAVGRASARAGTDGGAGHDRAGAHRHRAAARRARCASKR